MIIKYVNIYILYENWINMLYVFLCTKMVDMNFGVCIQLNECKRQVLGDCWIYDYNF